MGHMGGGFSDGMGGDSGGSTSTSTTPATPLAAGANPLNDPLGADISVFPSLDVSFGLVGGVRCIKEMIFKRLTTPRGLLWNHPDFGYDVRMLLNETMSDAKLGEIQQSVRDEVSQDERIVNAQALLAWDVEKSALTIAVSASAATGPFTLVLLVTGADVTLLSEV